MRTGSRGLLFLLAALFCLCGCRRAPTPPPQPAIEAPAPHAADAPADDLGRVWDGPLPARSVVSLAPNVTEIVCALGARDRLVGVDAASDYPPEVAKVQRVGQFLNPNLERIVALRPDVVFLSSATVTKAAAEELRARFHAPVFVLNPRRVSDVVANIQVVGQVLGLQAEADAVTAEMQARFDRVEAAVAAYPRRTLFLEVWHDPLTTIGPNTVLDDLIRMAGGENVAAKQPREFPTFSLEALIRADPEVYVVATMADGRFFGGPLNRRPGYQALRAVKHGRVHRVPADPVLRPTPRLAEGAEHLARAIHPEAFQ